MLETILYATLLFISFLIGFRLGSKREINPIKVATNVIRDTKNFMNETKQDEEALKKEKEIQEGLKNIMNY